MEDKIVFLLPQNDDDNIFEVLDGIESVSLLSLCARYIREHHLSVDKYQDCGYNCWAIYNGQFPKRRFVAKFDTEDEAYEYLYDVWVMPFVQDEYDYFSTLYVMYWVIAERFGISIMTVESLVKWNEKRRIARENRDFRYDYAHYRRVLIDKNSRKSEIERIAKRIEADMKCNGAFTRAFKRHFGIDILHLTPAGVADVLVWIRWFGFKSVEDGVVAKSLRD